MIKKNAKILLTLTIIIISICFFWFTMLVFGWPYPYYYNNYQVSSLLQELKELKLVGESKIIETQKGLSIFWGNSNHCDVIVQALVESNINTKEFTKQTKKDAKNIIYPGGGYSALEIFTYRDGKVYYIGNDKILELGTNKMDNWDKCINCDTVYDMEAKEELYKLIRKVKKYNPEKYYYILWATDQLDYAHDDFRCN